MADVLQSQSPTIAFCISQVGQQTTVAAYTIPFFGFVEQFNIGKNMSGPQILNMISLIIDKYPNYTPECFVLFFKRALSGQYGKVYDRIDTQVIMEWLKAFDLELDEETVNLRNKQASHYKQENKNTPQILLPILKDIVEKTTKPMEPQQGPRKKTDAEIQVQNWITEFDNLYMNSSNQQHGMRLIYFNDQWIDINEFLEIKLQQNVST